MPGNDDTYRLSDGLARRQLYVSLGFALLVLMGCAVKWYWEGGGLSGILAAVAVAVFAGFYFGRTYRQTLAIAATHSLTLDAQGIVIRDGATERRIPYGAIEVLRVRRPMFGTPNFTLTVNGLAGAPFYGYDDINRLIFTLAGCLPGDRVKGLRDDV